MENRTETLETINARANVLNKLKEVFPEEILEKREGPNKKNNATGRWEKQWFSYIPVAHLQERLDAVLPLQWHWTILDSHYTTVTKEKYIKEEGESKGRREPVEEQHVIVLGRLTLNLPDGKVISRDAFGGSEMTKGTSPGDPHKGAASNAFRKAAMMAGLGAYLALNGSTDLVESPVTQKEESNSEKNNPFTKSSKTFTAPVTTKPKFVKRNQEPATNNNPFRK